MAYLEDKYAEQKTYDLLKLATGHQISPVRQPQALRVGEQVQHDQELFV